MRIVSYASRRQAALAAVNSQTIQLDGTRARNEALRKLIHIAFGFVALSLKYLTYGQALALAAAAIVHNAFVFPLVFGRYVSRRERWSDIGILLYPVAVFIVIAIFRDEYVHIAAAAWCVLAFGDGCASLVGRNFGKRKWPWNRDKSVLGTVAFIEAAIPAAYAICLFMPPPRTLLPLFLNVTVAVLVAALIESLPTRIDDNLTVTFTAALTLWWMEQLIVPTLPALSAATMSWLVANLALATLGYFGRSVSVSGWLGGIVLGSLLIVCAGWPVYIALLAFFVIGTSATKLGYSAKAKDGLAQEKGGRRGFSHAFANVGVAALCAVTALLTDLPTGMLWLMAIASLATAAADTTSSEVGQWIGKRAFLPLTFRPVPRGTEGAVSVEGTLAGALAGGVVGALGVAAMAWRSGRQVAPLDEGWARLAAAWNYPLFWTAIGVVALAAFVGSYTESIIGSLYRDKEKQIPNGVLNFLNTAIGAAAAVLFSRLAGLQP